MLAIKKPVCIIKIIEAIEKAIKVITNKSFSAFDIQSDFSFSIIDKISVMSIFFFYLFKVVILSEFCEKVSRLFLTGCIFLGKYKCEQFH